MTIIAQYLFGSHARNDFSEGSDIDILSILDDGRFSNAAFGIVNVSYYPASRFLEAAAKGDLFVMHIIMEAQKIYDCGNFDARLRETFKQKNSYELEIKNASELAWFLIQNEGAFEDWPLFNRRAAWCVRTILIAKSIPYGRPYFSTATLSAMWPLQAGLEIMQRKSSSKHEPKAISQLIYFLHFHDLEKYNIVSNLNMSQSWWHFRLSNNAIALKTIDTLISSVSKDIYGVDFD